MTDAPTRRTPRNHPAIGMATLVDYALPVLPMSFIQTLTLIYFVKFGTDVLLIEPHSVALIFGLSRVWDAVVSPAVGFLSDRTALKIGRRRSWMLASAVALPAMTLMLWVPPEGNGPFTLAWLYVAAFGFWTAMATIEVPQQALGAELSQDARDRARLFGARGVASMLGSAGGLMIGLYVLRTAEQPRQAALELFAVLGLICFAATAWSVWRLEEPAEHAGRGGTNPLSAYRDILRNRYAMLLIAIYSLLHLTIAGLSVTAPYALEYVLEVPEATELFMAAFFIPTLLSIPLWVSLSKRHRKRQLWIASNVVHAVALAGLFFIQAGTPLAVLLLPAVVMGFASAAPQIFGPAMQAEIVDADELETGERKEGVYFAAIQLAGKIAGAAVMIAIGYSLEAAGFVPNVRRGRRRGS